MSDNPGTDNEELANLGINFDANAFANDINAAEAKVEEFGKVAADSILSAEAVAERLAIRMAQVATSVQPSTDSIKDLNAQLEITTEKLNEIQNQQSSGPLLGRLQASNAGAGVDINEMPSVGDITGEGGSVGSLFGAAHGLRAASGLANMVAPGSGGALTGAADVGYLIQGFRSIEDILPRVNDAIKDTPGLLGPLAEGLGSLGVPLSGLVAVGVPVAAALAGMLIAINQFIAGLKSGADAIAAGVKQIQEEGKLEGSGTSSSLTEARDKAIAESSGNQQALDALKAKSAQLTATFDAESEQGTNDIALGTAIGILNGQISDAQKTVDAASGSISNYNQALQSGQVDTNTAAEATRNYAQATIDAASRFAQYDDMNGKQVTAQIDKIADEQKAREQAISILEQSNDSLRASNDENGKNNYQIDLNQNAINKLRGEYSQAVADTEHLTTVSRGLADARDAEAAASQRVLDLGKQLQKIDEDRAKAEQDLITKTADAKQKELDAEQQYTQGSLRDVQQRADIALKESRQETQIKEATFQSITDMGTKLSEAENKAATDLGRQFQDDQTKLANDRSKTIRDEGDQEREDLENHLQKLADIQNQQHNSDQQALLDRNFLQLAKNKESNSQAVNQENERYVQQENDRREHLSNQLRDEQINEAQLEAQQRLAYQRKIDDLQTAEENQVKQAELAEQRKLETQRTGEQQALSDLSTNERYRIQLLQSGLKAELDLLQFQEQQRLAIIQQSINSLASGSSGGSIGGGGNRITPTAFAEGGSFDAFNPFVFNEPGSSGNERVNIGGQSFGSNSAALVIPLKSGSVDKGSGGQSVVLAPTFNIYESGNPEATANIAVSRMQDLMESITRR